MNEVRKKLTSRIIIQKHKIPPVEVRKNFDEKVVQIVSGRIHFESPRTRSVRLQVYCKDRIRGMRSHPSDVVALWTFVSSDDDRWNLRLGNVATDWRKEWRELIYQWFFTLCKTRKKKGEHVLKSLADLNTTKSHSRIYLIIPLPAPPFSSHISFIYY